MRLDMVKLRAEMFRKEITQTDLAEKVGISRPTINGICNGRACSDETAEKIASALGVDMEVLRETARGAR